MTQQHDPTFDRDAQGRREATGDRLTPYIGAPVRILARFDDNALLYREARVMRDAGYLGVVTGCWDGKSNPWRVDFGDEYAYLTADEFEVLK